MAADYLQTSVNLSTDVPVGWDLLGSGLVLVSSLALVRAVDPGLGIFISCGHPWAFHVFAYLGVQGLQTAYPYIDPWAG